jgi:nucleotide-binding universal stress UspA family protein
MICATMPTGDTGSHTTSILLAYDGSKDAAEAVRRASVLFPASDAVVLTVWEPIINLLARTGGLMPGTGYAPDADAIDEACARRAAEIAAEGAALAERGGLSARPLTRARRLGVAQSILAAAGELDAAAIVVGSRGLSGVRSLLGSVSHAVLQHAGRTVIVVPSAADAAERGAA